MAYPACALRGQGGVIDGRIGRQGNQLIGVSIETDVAPTQRNHSLRATVDVFGQVCTENDGTLACRIPDRRDHLMAEGGVQTGGRLVEQDDRWPARENGSQISAPTSTARQR